MTDQGKSPHVALALQAISTFVSSRTVIGPPADVHPDLTEKAGAFVSLKRDGQLRGCIGTVEPCQPTVALEIIHNGISAATRDPRFEPVRPDELADLVCSVDVLMPAQPVMDVCELDPMTYGVIVEYGYRRGLLLPDLEGVDTAALQIEIACRKAGILPGDPYKLHRFEVKRYY